MNAKKILIVDDDQDVRLGLTARLKAQGYAVVLAADGTSAIAVARQEMPDLILLDLGLLAGDGWFVLERLRALMPLAGVPIVVLTALDASANRERVLRSGATAFFQKPAQAEELLAAIRQALRDNSQPATAS